MQGTTITLVVAVGLLAMACGSSPTIPILTDPPPTAAPQLDATTSLATNEMATPVGTVIDADDRRRQIETITKRLWFGWYAAVAARDVERLDSAVALNRIHADGRAAIETSALAFSTTPRIEDYRFSVIETLHDDDDCIVVALREDPAAFLVGGEEVERIGVFWNHEGHWYLGTSWTIDTPEFAWLDDCALMVREFA